MNNEQIVAENEQIQSNEPTTMVLENGIDLSTEITKTEEVLLEEVKNDDSANSVLENQTLSNEIVQTASALETIESSTNSNEIILEEFVDVVKDENQEVLTPEQNIDVTPEVNIEAKKNESENQQTQSTEQIEKESKIIEDKKEDDSKTTVVESIEPNKTKRIPKERYDELFNKLAEFKERNEPFEVYVKARVKGGLRVFYEDVPLFLPVSHFSMRKTPTEQELKATEGTKLKVHVHELQEYEEGRKTAIVTRKQVLIEELWNNLQIGDIVEGRVSSIASFGVFLDLGGIEGLIHVSRLSQFRIENPNDVFKKGDLVRAVVVELDKERNRIALSRKELEESPWKNIEQEFPPQSRHTGTIRKLTEFGAYVELKPGVDGLLRTPEISWTKRIKKPSEVLKLGQKIEVEVLAVSEEKRTIALSYKKTIPNPWFSLVDRFPVGTTLMGKVSQVLPQGMVVSISDDVDGFMPRSKMRPLLKGNKIPYHSGDQLEVIIADLIPDEESLILSPKIDENMAISASETDDYKSKRSNQQPQGGDNKANKQALNQNAVTLVDLLSESDRNSLLNL
ncbi:MAG: S1 RNA-binding domain-containing protein [Candidatus Kapabacteria bacterium]|nr:S1 RNA-binding domain-containing protein [Candidatus Kapabacteria bacterium]